MVPEYDEPQAKAMGMVEQEVRPSIAITCEEKEFLMATIAEKIIKIAFDILMNNPLGLRYAELQRKISASDTSLNVHTISGTIWNLDIMFPQKVYKPSRGLFRLLQYRDPNTDQLKDELVKEETKIAEEKFYAPFADWLKNDLEECTKAISLGGNKFRDKWGTPDVIGIRKSMRSDIIEAPIEIVSAEIKPEVSQLVTAFGQACAYCLYSHKSHLVVPQQSPQDELARLDSLCQIFGIGLVLFDNTNDKNPNFDIRVRPRKQDPDLFYTNKYMKYIEKEMFT